MMYRALSARGCSRFDQCQHTFNIFINVQSDHLEIQVKQFSIYLRHHLAVGVLLIRRALELNMNTIYKNIPIQIYVFWPYFEVSFGRYKILLACAF